MTVRRKTEFEERCNPEDFNSAVRRIQDQRQNASEYAGAAGQLTKNEIELKGLNRKAFGWHLQLCKMDSVTRIEVVRNLLQYEHCAGTFDQMDAFDDLGELAQRIVDRLPAPGEAAAPERVASDAPVVSAGGPGRRKRAAAAALDALTAQDAQLTH
jgi:hypothetical protein